jgi:hypothetical protein
VQWSLNVMFNLYIVMTLGFQSCVQRAADEMLRKVFVTAVRAVTACQGQGVYHLRHFL